MRREKALVHSGESPARETGSLYPVAIGAVVEATKLLKPPVKRVALGDPASKLLGDIPAYVPLSGRTMEFDGAANCVAGCGMSSGDVKASGKTIRWE